MAEASKDDSEYGDLDDMGGNSPEDTDTLEEKAVVTKMMILLKAKGYRVIAPGSVMAKEQPSSAERPIPPAFGLPKPDWRTPAKPTPVCPTGRTPLSSSFMGQQPPSTGHDRPTTSFNPIPKLSTFSGKEAKGDVDFDLWINEVKCLLRDPHYDADIVGQAIRKSLRGEAARIAMHLGEGALPIDIVSKLITSYGSVLSEQQIMQTFYMARQQDSESIASWACRLEDLVFQAESRKYITKDHGNQMLIQKFWAGLTSEKVRSATRHKLESISSFNALVTAVRAVEQELLLDRKSVATVKQHQQQTSPDGDFALLAKQLIDRMEKLETKVNTTPQEDSPFHQLLQRMDKLEAKLSPGNASQSGDKPQASQSRNKTWKCYRCGQEGHIALGCRVHLNKNGQLPGDKQ